MGNKECRYKDDRISLTEAYDDKTDMILSWDEVKKLWDIEGKFLIRCPACSEKVTLVDGEIRNGFFRHFHTGERKDNTGRKNSGGGTSAWHHRWQMRFPDHREKQLTGGEDRADVLLTDKKLAIEFQKADFSGSDSDTCKVRSAYWTSKGYRIAWVFAWDGGSEFSGYFPRGTGKDGATETVMELPEYEKLFGNDIIKRQNIEVHFLSMDGSNGFEFIPTKINIAKKVVHGKIMPSYFKPFAPVYREEMDNIRGKAVYSSHLEDPVVKPICLDDFYQAMEKAQVLAEADRKKPQAGNNAQDTSTTAQPSNPRLFTVYELIRRSLNMGVKVLIMERTAVSGETDEYKIYPQDYKYYIEKYAKCYKYTFDVHGSVRRSKYKRSDGGGFIRTIVYYPGSPVWKPKWAVTLDDKQVNIENFY